MAFDYRFPVPVTDPACKSSFVRGFEHDDWVDGQDIVQAEATSEEEGFNVRFHKIERDLDALGSDLKKAFACLEILRGQVVAALADIKSQFNAKPPKEGKEGKDFKDAKDGKDAKDAKDGKDAKDHKDGKDGKDGKDVKDVKDAKDGKDTKDHKDGKEHKDLEKILGAAEKQFDNPAPALRSPMSAFLWREPPVEPAAAPAAGHAFIRPAERPVVGGRALVAAATGAAEVASASGTAGDASADVGVALARVADALARLPLVRAELDELGADLGARGGGEKPPEGLGRSASESSPAVAPASDEDGR